MVCRSKERGEIALQEIKQESNNDNVFLHICDISSQASIRQFVSEFLQTHRYCNVLVNNAGVMISKKLVHYLYISFFLSFFFYLFIWLTIVSIGKREETEDGLEKTFATNTIGTYLITELLIPCLIKTAEKDNIPSRVIVVSSGGMLVSFFKFTLPFIDTSSFIRLDSKIRID